VSYGELFGWTGLPEASKADKDNLIEYLNDKSVSKNARVLAMILALWSESISFGKAEALLVELGIMSENELIKAYKELNGIQLRRIKNKKQKGE
jgi:hypothetical protein